MVQTKVRLRQGPAPTVDALTKDKITQVRVFEAFFIYEIFSVQIACSYWAPYTTDHMKYEPNIIAEIYQTELLGSGFNVPRIVLLEFRCGFSWNDRT